MNPKFQVPSKYKKKKPLWDLERDGITFSMLSHFLICRERFRLTSVEGWTSKGLSIPIEFGQIFHWVLEKKINSPRTSISKLLKEDLKRRRKTLKKSQLEDYEIILGLVQVTLEEYFEYWKTIPTFEHPKTSVRYYDTDLKYCLAEEVFRVKHILSNGRTILLRGKIDAAFREPLNKALWLQENKTKGNIDGAALSNSLHKDFQTMLYCLALRHLSPDEPEGVLYNVIRRPQLRKGKSESLQVYLTRTKKDIQKRPEHYYMRWLVSLGPKDLDTWIHHSLDPILHQLLDWWDSIKRNPFDPWMTTIESSILGRPNLLHYERPFGIYDSFQFSQKGDMYDPIVSNDFSSFYQRDTVFPELED